MPSISPNPACYRVLGRADEIARAAGSPHTRAEHLFLAIIHDDHGMPAQVLARLADLRLLEAAVTAAASQAIAQPDERPSRPEVAGFGVATEMGDSYVGTWHLLLALVRDRQSVLARALAGLVDLDELETAVTDVTGSREFRGFKDSFGAEELLLPAGLDLDQALIGALTRSVPAGATFGFNWRKDDGRPWIYVSGPGDPQATLNAALIALGRPTLS